MKVLKKTIPAIVALVTSLIASADDRPLLEFRLNEARGEYRNSGILNISLSPVGLYQQHGEPGSGVSGQRNDRAWDSSANPTQGVGDITNDSALVSQSQAFNFDNIEKFTMTFWYKTNQYITRDAAVRFFMKADRATTPVNEGVVLRANHGRLELRAGGQRGDLAHSEFVVTSNRFSEGEGYNRIDEWVFVALTWDGSTLMFFVADTENPLSYAGGGSMPTRINPTSFPLVLANTRSFNRGLAGFMDNFRFYDRALPTREIEQLRQRDVKGD